MPRRVNEDPDNPIFRPTAPGMPVTYHGRRKARQRARARYMHWVNHYKAWDPKAMVTKRLQLLIHVIALEERLQLKGLGAIPPTTMQVLRLLSNYRWISSYGPYLRRNLPYTMQSTIPFTQLITACGHEVHAHDQPVVARLREGDDLYDRGEAVEAVFCCLECAEPRTIKQLLAEFDYVGQ